VPSGEQQFQDLVILDGPHETGPFTFRWPTGTEDFDCSWDLTVDAGGHRHRVRHGLGTQQVYGAQRRHSVTFVDDWAAAEGVAPDDYEASGCLISPLKDHAGRLIRPGGQVPASYGGFRLVSHAEQIVVPYSRDALAVRLHADDITSWVGYALARLSVRRPGTSEPSQAPPAPAGRAAPVRGVACRRAGAARVRPGSGAGICGAGDVHPAPGGKRPDHGQSIRVPARGDLRSGDTC
jgi:hypothetical protein